MDDRFRLRLEDGMAHGARVEQVERDRLRAERAHGGGASRRVERAGHLVPSIDQLGHEAAADGTGRAHHEDSHRILLFGHIRAMSRVDLYDPGPRRNVTDWLAEQFEQRRTRLRAVAYRMLGSLTEADDAVQEAWLRLSRTGPEQVDNLDAWLTTVVARISLIML